MYYLRLALLIQTTLLITACNVGDGNFGAGGASLGGSGTGSGQGPSPTPPPDIGTPEVEPPIMEEFEHRIYKVNYPEIIRQNCGVMQRSLQFIDSISKEPQQGWYNLPLNRKVTVLISVHNTSTQPVYEFIHNCQSVVIMNGLTEQIEPAAQFSCKGEEAIHVYQPNQCKTYQYEMDIPITYEFSWNVRHQAEYGPDIGVKSESRMQCPLIEIPLQIRAMPEGFQDNTIVQNTSTPCDVNVHSEPSLTKEPAESTPPPLITLLPPPWIGPILP